MNNLVLLNQSALMWLNCCTDDAMLIGINTPMLRKA